MFEKLKQRSLRKHLEKNLKQRDLSEINAPLRTLGFLVDEKALQDFDKLYDFSKSLSLPPKDVKVFSFLEAKKKLPSLRQNQVYHKDFNWKGEIENQNAIDFLQRDFDVLVGWYSGTHRFLDLLVSESNAKFKVGFPGGDSRLFDLLIHLPITDISGFEKELKKYLTLLNKI